MFFRYSQTAVACTLALSALLSGCSKDKVNEQKSDAFTATTPATGEASPLLERNEKQRLITTFEEQLKKSNINIKVTDIKKTEVPNIYWVNLDGAPSIYATADGKYVIQGDILGLGDGKIHNIGEDLQATENKKLFAALDNKDLIVYPAQGKTQHIIYVFTDASCPYCHKLHESLPEITAKGIEVRYIAWPRGEQFYPTMQSIWCSQDRKAAFAAAVKGENVSTAECKNPVKEQYMLGMKIGVNGTPAIYSQDGHYLGGYLTADELNKRLSK
ncbi:DsbC family protein [Acinetobacter sp. B5B]|uniref:DsbC family protein n=1 Tax=Acinetobacter baretiae TaxID=2605383 RepID=UPI0018C25DF5|nr:DsbC family protein [Acinetobacter baretiae]MBF7681745.1 DsbC family protein [Acinetobacter baretiae]